MIPPSGASRAEAPGPAVRFALLSLIFLAFFLPPETRGESAAGCALLVVLVSLLSAREIGPGAGAATALALAAVWPLAAASLAPGSAPGALATVLLAAAAGASAVPRARELRAGEALPILLTVVAAVAATHGLWQVLHGLDALARNLADGPGFLHREVVLARLREGRAFGAFATPAALGGFLALCLPVTCGFAAARRGAPRALLVGAALLQGAGLAATASATAIGSLGAATALFVARRRIGSRRLVVASIAAAAVVAAGLVAVRGTKLVDPEHPDSPWRLRAGNVRVAIAMAAEHPWTGVGPGAFGEAFPAYRRPGDNESRHAHSLPFELIAEYGLPIGALLTALFLALFLGPLLTDRAVGTPWTAGLAVGLGAFAIQNLADFTAFFPSFLWGGALLRGALAQAEPAGSAGGRRWGAIVVGAAVAAGAVVLSSGLAWNARVSARQEAGPEGDRAAAERLSRRAVALAPWDVEARVLLAEVLGAGGSPGDPAERRAAEARASIEAAVRLSPVRPGARALRARLRLSDGDVPGAYADLCEAARLHPLREDYARDRDAIAAALPDPDRVPEAR